MKNDLDSIYDLLTSSDEECRILGYNILKSKYNLNVLVTYNPIMHRYESDTKGIPMGHLLCWHITMNICIDTTAIALVIAWIRDNYL